jgi:HSP20 family protein
MSRLIRWNPTRQPAINLFDELLDRPWRSLWEEGFNFGNLVNDFPMDVTEDDLAYHVQAEIPGVDPEAIQISLENDVLTIATEAKTEREERDGERVLMTERRYGKISRSVRLPNSVNADQIDATYHNGVLEVRLPKLAEKQTKRIEVKALKSGK